MTASGVPPFHPMAHLARGDRSGTYNASEVTDEPERERLFALAEGVYPGYADHRERTAKIGPADSARAADPGRVADVSCEGRRSPPSRGALR
jgi:hypothetical protein